MKKQIILISLFMALLVLPTTVWLVIGGTDFDGYDENRELAKFPEFSDKFLSGFETYYCDHMPFRSEIIFSYKKIQQASVNSYADMLNVYVPWLMELNAEKEPDKSDDPNKPNDPVKSDADEEHTHSYTTVTTPPTCTEQGFTTYTCECGETYKDDVTEATGHTYTDTVIQPACTQQGYTNHVCSVCNDTYADSYIPATGHIWSDWTETKAATTSQEGERERTCSVCGEKEHKVIPVIEEGHTHSYVMSVKEATCTENGYYIFTCSCGDTYEGEVIPAHHTYVATVTEPTCTKAGSTTYTCSSCGDTYTGDKVSALKHNWSVPEVIAPTCTEKGYTMRICERCGQEYRGSYTDATGHIWTTWTVTKNPTSTELGERERHCDVCGVSQTESVAAGSAWLRTGYTSNGSLSYLIGGLTETDPSLKTYMAPVVMNEVIMGRKDRWLFYQSAGLDNYRGMNKMSEDETKALADAISELDTLLKSMNKTLVYTVCPDKEEIYGQYLPTYSIESLTSRGEDFMKYLSQNSDVISVYSKDLLLLYKDTYQIYSKYDTHWNAAGGYINATEILKKLGLPTVDLYDIGLTKTVREEACDLDIMAKKNYQQIYNDDTEWIIDFLPDVTVTTELSYQRNEKQGEEYRTIITTSDSENTQQLVIIGDSFRRAMNPVFFKSFAKVSSFHMREISSTKIDPNEYWGEVFQNPTDEINIRLLNNLREADVVMLEGIERGFSGSPEPTSLVMVNRLIKFFTEYKATLQ